MVARLARRQRTRSFGRVVVLGACLGGAPLAACSEPERGEPVAAVAERATWSGPIELRGSDQLAGDGVGTSIVIQGDTIVTGAPWHKLGGVNKGAVYVFGLENGAWVQKQKLSDAATDQGSAFGAAVALSGDRLLVGAPGKAVNGAVYVYERSGGTFTYSTTISAPVAQNMNFGDAVGLDGTIAAIGAPDYSSQKGAGWIYELSNGTWNSVWSYSSFDSARWGERAAVSGNHAIFAAPLDDGTFQNQGLIRIMVRDENGAWTSQGDRSSLTTAANRNFGQGIAFDGSTLVVGEKGATGVGNLFEHSAGSWTRRLETMGPIWNTTDGIAYAVAVSGKRAAATAPGYLAKPNGVQVYVREASGWTLEQHLVADVTLLREPSLSMTATHVAMGAPFDSNGGSVQVFTLDESSGSGGAGGAGGTSGAGGAGSGGTSGNGGAGNGGAGASAGGTSGGGAGGIGGTGGTGGSAGSAGSSGGSAGTGDAGASTGGATGGSAGDGGSGASGGAGDAGGSAGLGGTAGANATGGSSGAANGGVAGQSGQVGGSAGAPGTGGTGTGGEAGAGAEGGESGENGSGSGGTGGRPSATGGSGGSSTGGDTNEAGTGGDEPSASGGTGGSSGGSGGSAASTGGNAGSGTAGNAGRPADNVWVSDEDGGCGCRVAGSSESARFGWLAPAAMLLVAWRRRSRRAA